MIYDISILAANTANNITIKNVLEQVVKIPEKYLPNTYFINLTVEQRESLNEGNTIYVDVDYDIYNCVEVVFFDQQPVYLKRYKTLQYFYGFGVNSRTNPGPYYYYYLAPASSNSQFKLQRSTINIPTATSELTNDSDFTTNANVEEAFGNLAFKTLVHTDANPIDFNNITEPGVYIIKNIGQTTLNAPEFFTDVGNVIGFNVILIVTHKLSQESAVYTWQELICGNSSKTISNHYSRVGTGAWSELQIPAGQIKAGTLNAGILCPTPSSSMSDLQIANKAYVDAKFAELKTYVDNALANVAYISES